MGPSVKFVLPIIDAFPDKKIGVIFVWQKRTNRGWGGLSLRRTFSRHSFLNDSPTNTNTNIYTNIKSGHL